MLFGGAEGDVIDAGKFSDLVLGGAGPDTIHGDNNWLPLIGSSDLIFGNDGPDWIDGGTGTDVILGGEGDDTLRGDNETPGLISADVLFGNQGRDAMNGGCSFDFVSGGHDNDSLLGDSNLLTEPLSVDFLLCGRGDDYADGGNAMDFILGERGADQLLGDNSANPRLSSDFIFGGPQADNIDGGNTFDFVWAGSGDDRVVGDQQFSHQLLSLDLLFGEDGCDTMLGGRGLDIISGGSGVDQIGGQDGPDLISGGDHTDIINGNDSLDCIWGNAGNDLIHGDNFVDILDGGDGNDCLYGDGGQDVVLGDSGEDCIHGGSHADVLLGNDGNDLIFGDGGPDYLGGGDGDDTLDGGVGPDLMVGGSGTDTLFGGPGIDILLGETRKQTASSGLDCTCQLELCPGTLCLYKFNDLNNNGVEDAGEPGLGGWSFTITGPGGTTTLVTDADGSVCTTLPAGVYTVTEQLQSGWIATTPATQTVNVVGSKESGITFGNRRRVPGSGQLCITKFEDTNANGNQDAGELGLSNWNFLVQAADGSTTILTTGPTGNICSNFGEGTYTVTEWLYNGWTNTTPLVQNIVVTANQQNSLFFGNRRQVPGEKGQLCITKFHDQNGNGLQEVAEPGLGGWQFQVQLADGSTMTLMTGPDGTVCATFLAGALTVTEQPQTGWVATTPMAQTVTVLPNQQNVVAFGNRRQIVATNGELCIFKFEDSNGNSAQDTAEAGLPNWTFNVTAANGTITPLTTGANGTICGTFPAGTYIVTEQPQAGWTNTTPITQTVVVVANQQVTLPFGNQPRRSVVPGLGPLLEKLLPKRRVDEKEKR